MGKISSIIFLAVLCKTIFSCTTEQTLTETETKLIGKWKGPLTVSSDFPSSVASDTQTLTFYPGGTVSIYSKLLSSTISGTYTVKADSCITYYNIGSLQYFYYRCIVEDSTMYANINGYSSNYTTTSHFSGSGTFIKI